MPYCSQCGKEMKPDEKFCTSCGANFETGKTSNEQSKSFEETVKEKFGEFNNTADSTNEFFTGDIDSNKDMAFLAYLGILILVPIFAAKNSRFARFQCNQGLALIIVGVGWSIVSSILTMVLRFLGSPLSVMFVIANIGVSLLLLTLMVIGIINAVTGKAKELPIIGLIKILDR